MIELVNLEECVDYVVKVVRRDDRTLYGMIKSRPDDEYLPFLFDLGNGGGLCDDGSCTEYYGDPDAFVKFADTIYKKGFEEGIGFSFGCDDD